MCEISLYVLLVYLWVSSRFSSFIPPAKLFFGVNEYDGKSTLTLPRIKQLISMDNWTRRDHILYACIKSLIWFHEHYFNDDYIVEMQYLFFFFSFFFSFTEMHLKQTTEICQLTTENGFAFSARWLVFELI